MYCVKNELIYPYVNKTVQVLLDKLID